MKIKTYTKRMKNWPKIYLYLVLLYALKKSVFIGKTQRGGAYEDGGRKRSSNYCNKAAKTRLWPHFCGLGVARWPHANGGGP